MLAQWETKYTISKIKDLILNAECWRITLKMLRLYEYIKYKSISAEFVNIGVNNLKIVIYYSLCVLKGDVTHKRLKK